MSRLFEIDYPAKNTYTSMNLVSENRIELNEKKRTK